MKKIFLIAIAISSLQIAMAQFDLPPSGGNARAKITEEVGITDITIKYSRPDVNKREGKMWGDGNVVTYGFATTNLNTNKNTNPWRAGANENTTITFEHDVKVEGRDVKAGTYGLFFALWPDSATLILSSKSTAWGSFYYDAKDDVLRTTIKPVALDKSVEWLKYEFIQQGEKSCTIALMWEKLMLPFRVDVDVDKIVITRLREQVESQAGFNNLNLVAAAQFCLNKNINLDEALAWSQRAAGLKSYTTLRTLATAYEKLNRIPLADSTMGEAVAIATVNQHIAYGRTLITQKRPDKAIEVLLAAQKKYGDVYAVNNGLMFGYSSKADYKKAIAAGEKALAQAPNDIAKKSIDASLVKLREGKDIN